MAERLKAMLPTHDKIRILIEIEELQGREPDAAWGQLRLIFQRDHQCERCAVIGDKKGPDGMAKLAKPFFNVRYFDRSEREEAWHSWHWVSYKLEDEIRQRAYQKWEAAGRPPSDGVSFWLAAEQEVVHQG